MSLFGGFDMDDDPIFGSHMRTMRHMNNMMNSLFANPYGMLGGFSNYDRGLTHRNIHNSLMPFAMPPMAPMPNVNRLLSAGFDDGFDNTNPGHLYSSSTSVVSMTSGPDGKPQVYKATSSTRCAPGGIKETQRTVSDSHTGTKKMAIGHHIGERAHIIEKEQNIHTGDREERQDYINIEEEEADEFNKEWETKTRSHSEIPRLTGSSIRNRHGYGHPHYALPAIAAGPSRRHRERQTIPSLVNPRRSIRVGSSTNASHNASSSKATPYSPSTQTQQSRKSKNIKTVNGSPPPADM